MFIVGITFNATFKPKSYITSNTGSMEPTITGKTKIITLAFDDYKVGDIIVFTQGGRNIIHRIIEITDGGYIIAQGDNNRKPDPWKIYPGQIRGRAVIQMPTREQLMERRE